MPHPCNGFEDQAYHELVVGALAGDNVREHVARLPASYEEAFPDLASAALLVQALLSRIVLGELELVPSLYASSGDEEVVEAHPRDLRSL